MKKTFSINLGNRVFNIDDDAYLHLKEYLDRIESYFFDEREREEIINDIEIRLSELFLDRLGLNRQVISMNDVAEAIKIMGDPKVIAGDKEQADNGNFTYARSDKSRKQRRLYRDNDNRIIGGVCGGLGTYLDVDPVIIRIVLLVLFLAFGFGFLIYIIMWIVVPKAMTTAQKLEMRGESVNASTIGNFVKEEYESMKKSFRRKK